MINKFFLSLVLCIGLMYCSKQQSVEDDIRRTVEVELEHILGESIKKTQISIIPVKRLGVAAYCAVYWNGVTDLEYFFITDSFGKRRILKAGINGAIEENDDRSKLVNLQIFNYTTNGKIKMDVKSKCTLFCWLLSNIHSSNKLLSFSELSVFGETSVYCADYWYKDEGIIKFVFEFRKNELIRVHSKFGGLLGEESIPL